jgi:ribosome-binding protein aMBF1 (putative translation factor)
MERQKKTTDAVEMLHRRYVKGDPQREAALQSERVNAEVAAMVYNRRMDAGLTQEELAKLVGTTQSVISRLEDADYEGHSLSMLQRIAYALKMRLKVSLVREAGAEYHRPGRGKPQLKPASLRPGTGRTR